MIRCIRAATKNFCESVDTTVGEGEQIVQKMLSRKCLIVLLIGVSTLNLQLIQGSFVVPIVKAVNDDVNQLGESPFWDPVDQVLYYVDIIGGFYCRLNPATGELKKLEKGGGVHVIIPYKNEPGNFIVSRNHQLFKLNFETEVMDFIAEVTPGENFNDAKVDRRGRLFVGTMVDNVPGGGALYRLDGNQLVKLAEPFTITNGLAWSNDANSSRLFLNDSGGRKIYSFDYVIETGTLVNKQVMIDTENSIDFLPIEEPDGMLIDEFGFIWVACWNGGRIVKIDVDTARVVDEVPMPTVNIPSSLARGTYEGRDGFYITTAACCSDNPRPDDGKIMHVSFQGGEVNTFVP